MEQSIQDAATAALVQEIHDSARLIAAETGAEALADVLDGMLG